jgi:hypothetical protein
MFRFTVRDLLWLTLVVAMGAGWFAHSRQLRGELVTADKWRLAFGGLAKLLEAHGWQVSVNAVSAEVKVWSGVRSLPDDTAVPFDDPFVPFDPPSDHWNTLPYKGN